MTRVGIVGLGSIAGAHVAALRHLAAEGWDIEIAGWAGRPESAAALGLLDLPEADTPSDTARVRTHDHPPDTSSGEPAEAERWRMTVFERLLARDDIDLIVDTSPSAFHGAHALAAIAAGKGIVIEKPLSTTPDEAAAVLAAAEASGAFGSVMAQRRFEPQHQWLHRHLRSGALGEVVAATVSLPWWRDDAYFAAASWRGEAPGGSVLLNQAIHSVDLLLWLLGDVADAAGFAERRWRPGEAADTSVGILRFTSGALATVLASTATPPGTPAVLTLHTTRGTASFTQATTSTWTFADVSPPPAASEVTAGASDPRAIGHVGHVDQWRDILTALRDGRPPSVTLLDGQRAVETCHALLRA